MPTPSYNSNHWSSSERSIAHVRKADSAIQTLEDHLHETAKLCNFFAGAIGLPLAGRLLGLLHDLGKYSSAFQKYIRDITGINGEKALEAAEIHDKGKIDHATAGAQFLWQRIHPDTKHTAKIQYQILCAALISHHSRSGIIDFINLQGKSPFLSRIQKDDSHSHLTESLSKSNPGILEEINRYASEPELISEASQFIKSILSYVGKDNLFQVQLALYTRFLYSCLLDADRISTIDFEDPDKAKMRSLTTPPDWSAHIVKLEDRISQFKPDSDTNIIRARISEDCRRAAEHPDHLLTLPVPTGGGKTLASLRFALHRAASPTTHPVHRIIYILPYTTILEQNAGEVREILDKESVLEHHSNLSEERDTKQNRVLSENWDSPIVFTTMVQFLNALFDSGTKSARRMHQMSNAILIFDEIQCLPIKTVHLFNNAINFLTTQANTTAVLCTATMPLLEKVNPLHGNLNLSDENCLVGEKTTLARELRRTEIISKWRPEKWSYQQITDFALEQQEEHQSVLIVCNTKDSAKQLFTLIKRKPGLPIVHLSTNMCPAHRKHKISLIREKLNPLSPQPVICVSTQLIEAGVDLDFGCVIRSLAGLDSIIQAAGRCNRHGHHKGKKPVFILNLAEENLPTALADIELGQEVTMRVLREYQDDPGKFDRSLLSEEAMNLYYGYFFYKRAKQMTYEVKARPKTDHQKTEISQNTHLIDILGKNALSISECNERSSDKAPLALPLSQAHSTAAEAFRVIDAPTQGILVPYDGDGHEGSKLIADLTESYSNENIPLAEQIKLHKRAQHYSVNAFPHIIKKLSEVNAISEIHPDTGIYELSPGYYDDNEGIILEALSEKYYVD
ncbi:MAG: CRISPR-associated helicase Cas3' [Verrucomicrobiales bacterium]